MALAGGQHGGIAGGNITCSSFVKFNSTDGKYVEATAGSDCAGIAPEGSRNVPALGLSTTYAATSGDPITPYGQGDVCLLVLAGTVVPGDRIKATTAGAGLVAAAGDNAYAVALQNGASGEKIYVRVHKDTVGNS